MLYCIALHYIVMCIHGQLPTPAVRQRPQRGEGRPATGSGGSYFEPTVCRQANKVEQASRVTCHLPGFGRNTAGNILVCVGGGGGGGCLCVCVCV